MNAFQLIHFFPLIRFDLPEWLYRSFLPMQFLQQNVPLLVLIIIHDITRIRG